MLIERYKNRFITIIFSHRNLKKIENCTEYSGFMLFIFNCIVTKIFKINLILIFLFYVSD